MVVVHIINPKLFLNVKNRKSSGYRFRLDIVNGNVPIMSDSGVARDLKLVLNSYFKFRYLSLNKTIIIRM